MEYLVTMPYIGGVLSENSYKFATRGTKPIVKFWMKELADKVSSLSIPKTDSYEIQVSGRFTDERRPDISNLFKIIGDSIQKALDVNDKFFRLVDKGYKLGYIDPELDIAIIPKGEEKL